MVFGKPTDLSEILEAVRVRAAAALEIDEAYVFPSLDLGDMDHQGGPSDIFLVLTNPSGRIEQPDVVGGGNELLSIDSTLQLELWNRLEVDEGYRDTAGLSHATLGILAQWRKLLKDGVGLQLYAPVGTGGQCILKEPMRVLSFDLRPRLPQAGWMKLVSRWEIKYVQNQE